MGCPLTQNSLNTRYLRYVNNHAVKLSAIAIQVNGKTPRINAGILNYYQQHPMLINYIARSKQAYSLSVI